MFFKCHSLHESSGLCNKDGLFKLEKSILVIVIHELLVIGAYFKVIKLLTL